MVDGLFLWRNEKKQDLADVKCLVINMDNGPERSGCRSQFLLRMVEFVDMTGLVIRIIYDPPYHNKYNGIERYWARREKPWNGYLLDSVNVVLNRVSNFSGRDFALLCICSNAAYEKGVKVCWEGKGRT